MQINQERRGTADCGRADDKAEDVEAAPRGSRWWQTQNTLDVGLMAVRVHGLGYVGIEEREKKMKQA